MVEESSKTFPNFNLMSAFGLETEGNNQNQNNNEGKQKSRGWRVNKKEKFAEVETQATSLQDTAAKNPLQQLPFQSSSVNSISANMSFQTTSPMSIYNISIRKGPLLSVIMWYKMSQAGWQKHLPNKLKGLINQSTWIFLWIGCTCLWRAYHFAW